MNRYEINRMVEFVRTLDIGINPEPCAIFDPLIQGFNVWAIPSDHPGGDWDKVVDKFDSGAYTKRCAYVGCAFYYAGDENYMEVTTDAYTLGDHLPEYAKYELSSRMMERLQKKSIHNRPMTLLGLSPKLNGCSSN